MAEEKPPEPVTPPAAPPLIAKEAKADIKKLEIEPEVLDKVLSIVSEVGHKSYAQGFTDGHNKALEKKKGFWD